MIIHAYILCWNEERMIRHTLNHYSSFCDKIILMDNESTDGTLAIAAEFPMVEVQPYASRNELSDSHYIKLKNKSWKQSRGIANWVIVCDADEFLYHPDGIRQELELRLKNQEFIPGVDGYNMVADTFPEDYARPIYEPVKMGRRATSFDKKIVFNPNQVKEINYGAGAHTCRPVLESSGTIDSHCLNLLHMKYLGKEYLQERHRQYAERMSYENKKNGWGKQYLDPGFADKAWEAFSGEHKPVSVVP